MRGPLITGPRIPRRTSKPSESSIQACPHPHTENVSTRPLMRMNTAETGKTKSITRLSVSHSWIWVVVFAAGIEKDKDAVRAGLIWSINNGMVEGQVTKLKLIKR